MWVIAGILLGLVVLAAVAGFHVGPHAHLLGVVAGCLAAVWLVVMALVGNPHPLLYALLGADVTITSLLGLGAWRVLKHPDALAEKNKPPPLIEGRVGTVVAALGPEGIVRVGGEQWTAVSLNGPVPVGGRVQVINAKGVRLEVWGESEPVLAPGQSEEGISS